MNTHLSHARHNKNACDKLHDLKEFPDWTSTTAFYCAMHYAYSILFPLTEQEFTYKNIDQYYSKNSSNGSTKHSLTSRLIQKYHDSIAEKYKQLKDTAHTARYHDYEIHPNVVGKMRRNMSFISEYCENKFCNSSEDLESKKETS
ncbi:hypothetical protein L0U88_00155 [Flavihumibacter sp. RY-1]|uniref:HEPN domain-containing protein n=1 Tax=Flavihumibacter fluminis TaxID=2909236 RepID=A0ABS9BBU4_9BACT|nr:hypothetical protein [Flavihumibacter fluminis]MCF1713037.1 hypothetical protein [Flavihumibacter fluminis]